MWNKLRSRIIDPRIKLGRSQIMKRILPVVAIAALAGLSACGQSNEAAAVENAYDNQVDYLENQADAYEALADNATGAAEQSLENEADALRDRADAIEEAGDNAADAVDAAR